MRKTGTATTRRGGGKAPKGPWSEQLPPGVPLPPLAWQKQTSLLLLACIPLAIAVHWPAAFGDFVFDDARAIVANPDLRADRPWKHLLHDDFWG
jgi:hypothetical protein